MISSQKTDTLKRYVKTDVIILVMSFFVNDYLKVEVSKSKDQLWNWNKASTQLWNYLQSTSSRTDCNNLQLCSVILRPCLSVKITGLSLISSLVDFLEKTITHLCHINYVHIEPVFRAHLFLSRKIVEVWLSNRRLTDRHNLWLIRDKENYYRY